ncbi:MAG: VWA domain-containing protein [Chloroflexota bacterium]|nr:VWA domain-containing protein [Chloroflexota bacterium]
MGFLTPIALTFAALSIPILVLYMLKLRRRDVLVSSTLLWQRLLRDREANAPWQRLRRNLLLLLQLLILALLTLALARPFVPAPTVVTGSVVVLLDASASMQARDVEPTRFDAARRVAREIVAGLGAGDVATIVAVGPQPRVLAQAEGDRSVLRRALDNAAPTNGSADWEAAFTLAAAGLAGAEETQVVLISDGALPETLPPLPGEVRFVEVGGRGDNLAITALATRAGEAGPQAFLRVANHSDTHAEPLVEFSADGVLFDARHLLVPAQGSANLTLTDLPYDLHVLQARLTLDDVDLDVLPLDDIAWAVHTPPVSGRVLLISAGNLFLERALGALPGLELARLAPNAPIPSSQGGAGEGYDLYVYDGLITTTLPAGNLWLIAPPFLPPVGGTGEGAAPPLVGGAGGGTTGFFTATAITRVADDDPLLRYVDLSDVHVLQARAVELPPGARVLIEAEGGPLLFVAERPEGRLAVLTFDLHDSDLPLQIAFPVLTANLADWLLPRGAARLPATIRPGDPIPIQPAPKTAEVSLTAPDGTHQTLLVGEEPPVFAANDQLGVYLVEQLDQSDNVLQSAVLTVNLFDEAESNIAPREVVRVGQAEVVTATREEQRRREFWPWLAGAALGVLVVEWWVYYVGRGDKGTRRWGQGDKGRGGKETRGWGDKGIMRR